MTIGWTSLTLAYLDLLVDRRIPEPLSDGDLYGSPDEAEKKLYLQAVVNMIMPAPSATSRLNHTTLVMHNLNAHKQSEFNTHFRENTGRMEPKCPMRTCIDS